MICIISRSLISPPHISLSQFALTNSLKKITYLLVVCRLRVYRCVYVISICIIQQINCTYYWLHLYWIWHLLKEIWLYVFYLIGYNSNVIPCIWVCSSMYSYSTVLRVIIYYNHISCKFIDNIKEPIVYYSSYIHIIILLSFQRIENAPEILIDTKQY